MNRFRKLIYTVILLISRITVIHSQTDKINLGYDISALKVYQKSNDNFILKESEIKDYSSRLEGNLFLTGGEFGKTQFELGLRFNTSLIDSGSSKLSIRQMYIEIPITDFSFFTIGKKRKEFGASSIFSFSNRLSPVEIYIDRKERVIPELIQYDLILSDKISLGSIIYFNDSVDEWGKINLCQEIDLSFDKLFIDIHFYYEKLKRMLLGWNIYYNFDEIGFFMESIIKNKNDQETLVDNTFTKKDGIQNSFAVGMNYQKDVYDFGVEYAYRSEGYRENEQNIYFDYIKSTKNVVKYNLNNFGHSYWHFSLGFSHFLDANTGIGIECTSTGDFKSQYSNLTINYLFKDAINFAVLLRYHSGSSKSEYIIMSPYKYYLMFFVSASF